MKTYRKFLMSGFITILIVVGGGYIALAVLLYVMQPSMIYYPVKGLAATPEQAGMKYEAVMFQTEDDLTLTGWFIPVENARGVLLFFHGNAGNISHRLESLRIFHQLGLSTFIFDYRGYGHSEGKPKEKGIYRDAEAAWRYLMQERGIDPRKIVVFGRSLGGSVAAWLARTQTPRALIIESVFTSARDLAADLYPYMPTRFITRVNYDTQDYLSRVTCPVLIVHSRHDEIIPFAHGQRLFRAAHEPKSFLEIRGGHNEGFYVSGKNYVNGLDSFLTKVEEY